MNYELYLDILDVYILLLPINFNISSSNSKLSYVKNKNAYFIIYLI